MPARPLLAACLASWLALACGTAPSAPAGAGRPGLAAELVRLGEQALEAGELAAAEDRFARALEADPASAAAQLGLGRTALARGDVASAEERFTRALEEPSTRVDARLGLARVAARTGRAAAAREQLERVLEADRWRADAHAELAALTGTAPQAALTGTAPQAALSGTAPQAALSGPAPRGPADLAEALRRAHAHPYDVAAGLAAASALAAAGRRAEAAQRAESLLWLADLDPKAARDAWALLVRLDPRWREWRIVRVDSWADESVRSDSGWEFRLRLAWLGASQALGPLLRVRFVPATLQGFSSRAASASLEAIDAAFRAQTPRVPEEGILAAFTARPPPRAKGGDRLGQAEFLGRRLAVRLEPEPGPSRVLLHELVHLYGGVHLADDVESLMNPAGGSSVLDALNVRITLQLRERRFRGDLESDVLGVIDLEQTTRAYEDALRTNLFLRRAGLADAMQMATTSRFEARRTAARVRELDPHLGDVARFVAVLLWRRDNPATAALLLEMASQLYGPRTASGLRAAEEAERIWQHILANGGSKG